MLERVDVSDHPLTVMTELVVVLAVYVFVMQYRRLTEKQDSDDERQSPGA